MLPTSTLWLVIPPSRSAYGGRAEAHLTATLHVPVALEKGARFAIREGGRHTPFVNGYRPQFYIRTTDVTGSLQLPEGVEMVMPGDNTSITAELHVPVALEKGARFAIREGGRTVGAGVVTKIEE